MKRHKNYEKILFGEEKKKKGLVLGILIPIGALLIAVIIPFIVNTTNPNVTNNINVGNVSNFYQNTTQFWVNFLFPNKSSLSDSQESLNIPVLTQQRADKSQAFGTCSGHGGVDCNRGADADGSVICKDNWADSSVSYSSMVMCDEIKNH